MAKKSKCAKKSCKKVTGKRTVSKKNASKKNAGKKVTASRKPQRITKRVVNSKRHTTGYVVGGESLSVPQVRKMASKGEIANVRVVGKHIQSLPGGKRLTDLPTLVK